MKRAFTLVELLVTIAVIGILAAMLLPALARSKVAAAKITCINNLHQISTALLSYGGEHGDALRAASTDFQIYFKYREDIQPYLASSNVGTNDAVFTCPGDNFDCTSPLIESWFSPVVVSGVGFHRVKQTEYSSYIFNGESANSSEAYLNGDTRPSGKLFSSVRYPSRLVLNCEISAMLALSAHPMHDQPANNAKNVVSFVDGHVTFIPFCWTGDMHTTSNPPPSYEYIWFDKM